jgi:ferric-dicitrate binding protein FerR (iron transport regulator)
MSPQFHAPRRPTRRRAFWRALLLAVCIVALVVAPAAAQPRPAQSVPDPLSRADPGAASPAAPTGVIAYVNRTTY